MKLIVLYLYKNVKCIIMIKKIGTSIKNISTKILIALIALSFAVWGIGDIFTGNSNPTIATVGKSKIKLNDFNLEYQAILENLRRSSEEPISEEIIKTLGIQNSVLNNIINNEYINLVSKSLGISSSENFLKRSILNNKNFHDQLGVFNQDYFNYFLNRNNISEKELINISKKALTNDIFLKTINSSQGTSNIIANNIKKKRDLARKAEVYEIDTTSMIIKEKITDAEIIKHYNEIKSTLLVPEKRDLNIISIRNTDIDNNVNIDSNELLEIYNSNIDFYKTPEKRKILQFIFDNELKAKDFLKNNKNLNNINDYIKKNNINRADVDLGFLAKDELDSDLGNIAFNLKENAFSKVIQSAFGWKVIYLEMIKSENNLSFDQVKNDIKNDLTTNILNERVYEKANAFYEKFIESNDLETSLKYVNLDKKGIKEVEINSIKNLNIENNILSEEELAKIIFNLNDNALSDPIEGKNNNLFFIHLEKINKSVPKTFDVAKKEVIDSLYNKKKRQQSKKIADTIYSDIINEKQSKQVYLTSSKTSWITNDSRINDTLDPKIKNIIFKTKLNSYSKINQLEEFKYFFVKPTLQSEKYLSTEKRTKTENILTNIDSNIKNDIINALLVDIKIEKKSSINQNFINSF